VFIESLKYRDFSLDGVFRLSWLKVSPIMFFGF
jgi:hypothetical protein